MVALQGNAVISGTTSLTSGFTSRVAAAKKALILKRKLRVPKSKLNLELTSCTPRARMGLSLCATSINLEPRKNNNEFYSCGKKRT
jgi:hypothetical protein